MEAIKKLYYVNQDFQSLLPDGSDGWLIKKGTKVNIEDEEDGEYLCNYIEYSFYIPKNMISISKHLTQQP